MIDYFELLKKYIDFLDEVEGSNFIEIAYNPHSKHFTKEEWEELYRLCTGYPFHTRKEWEERNKKQES